MARKLETEPMAGEEKEPLSLFDQDPGDPSFEEVDEDGGEEPTEGDGDTGESEDADGGSEDGPTGDEEEGGGSGETGEGEPEDSGESTDGYILKVDGEEITKTRDEMVVLAQKGLAADKRMEIAAEGIKALKEAQLIQEESENLKNDVEWVRNQLLNDPIKLTESLLLKSGYTPQQVFQEMYPYLEKKFAYYFETKENPEKHTATLVEQENQRLKQEAEQYKLMLQQKTTQDQRGALEERMQAETIAALKEYDLPPDEDSIFEVSQIILAHEEETGKELTAQRAVNMLKDKLEEKRANSLKSLRYEDLAKDEEILKRIREADLEALKNRKGAMGATPKKKAGMSVTKPRKLRHKEPKTFSEIFGETI
jgi:predicted DNA binding CopG/RHH family protein